MVMSSSLNATREVLGCLIRSLTSLLHEFDMQRSPSKRPHNIHHFLRYFTILLAYNDNDHIGDDHEQKKVDVAITGAIVPGQPVRVLVVVQNPYLDAKTTVTSLNVVKKEKRSLKEVVTRPSQAPALIDHIADLWSAFSAFDRQAADWTGQVESLELFILSRSYKRLAARLKAGSSVCGGKRLTDVIGEWKPDPRRPEVSRKWVRPPNWLLSIQDLFSAGMNVGVIQGASHWEFSDNTKLAWSKVLLWILQKLDDALEQVTLAEGETGGEEEETQVRLAMRSLNLLCRTLYYFVVWDAGIVKSLLTRTDMLDSITTTCMPTRAVSDDDLAELRQEPGETKGNQVLRYLKSVIAWHAAVHRLCLNPARPELLNNIDIGLVEVPCVASSVLTLDEVADTLFTRFPDMIDRREDVLMVLKDHHSDTFSGCSHATATLIGLVNHYGYDVTHASHGPVQDVQQFVQPVAESGEAVISAYNKCCWCCDWLGKHLETPFTLPGTHGVMYPWDPPKSGVSVAVLETLEGELWKELYRAVSSTVASSYSPPGSAASSPGLPGDMMVVNEPDLCLGEDK